MKHFARVGLDDNKMSTASKVLMSAGGLKNTQPAFPNFVHELNPSCAEYWFGMSAGVRGGGKYPRIARYGVHGDGSCAYHSICAALNVDDYVHQTDDAQKQIAYKFRCSFADKLTQDALRAVVKKTRSKSPVRLSEVQEALCDPKVWADETTIRFMAETLDMNLIFLDMTKNNVYCGVHHVDAVKDTQKLPPTIIVLWVNHSHFEPLAQIINVGPRMTEIRIVFDPSKNEHDAELIRALMRRYKMQCSPKRKPKTA